MAAEGKEDVTTSGECCVMEDDKKVKTLGDQARVGEGRVLTTLGE